MRLLPDKNLKENYKKRYNANYDKIMAYRQNRAEKKSDKTPISFETRKQQLIGAAATIAIFGCLFCAGCFISSHYSEKEAEIYELEQKAAELDESILQYQLIDSDEKYAQINEAVQQVADLQNQYATGTFSNDFEAYADRYLGSYNNNWIGSDTFYNPVWKGYVDSSCDFRDMADMIFILYDSDKPVTVVKVSFELSASGNLGRMTHFDKMRLT